MLATRIRNLSDDLVSLFFPRLCAACEGHLMRGEAAICTMCLLELPRTRDELDPANNAAARVFWGRIPLQSAAAVYQFVKEGKVQELIHNLKYNGRKDAGVVPGRIFGNEIKNLTPFNTIDLIIPVPLHPDRLRKRGYNQAAAFGEGLAAGLSIPIWEDQLQRVKATQTQTRKGRSERWDNVDEMFAVAKPEELKGKHVVLVDDVITTGATIEACAIPLLKIEGLKLSVISLAAAR
jgi:ComF family protein